MELMMNEQGVFEEYDDTYDVVIHCDSKEARDEVLADLKAANERLDVLEKIRAEIMLKDGLEEALEIIDKYKKESKGK